jgi:1,4-alpha-glucan branching enzyme
VPDRPAYVQVAVFLRAGILTGKYPRGKVPGTAPAPPYGGSGVGNLGAVEAVEEEWHGRPASATITVPPLGVLWLAPDT